MKNYKVMLAVFAAMVGTASYTQAQKKISEGTATYTVNYELPADKQQYAEMMPKEITCYFRGDSTAAIINQGGASIKGVQNFKANYQSILIDIPAASKKIAVVMTPAEVQQANNSNPKFTGTKTSEKQTIAGYNCTKVVATDVKTGTKYDAWITNDIQMAPNSMSQLTSDFGGVPVKFVTFNQGVKINAVLKEVNSAPVPKGFFSPGKDYESMSMEQLKSMTGQ